MVHTSILTSDFFEAASNAGWRARQAALAAGHPVVFVDAAGRCVEERPNGKCFEIRLDPTQPRESHRIVLRELASTATQIWRAPTLPPWVQAVALRLE